MHALFTYCACTVHVFKNIKNWSYGTIHTFKNYFATVFLVFRFQFSVSITISSIQTDHKRSQFCKKGYTDFDSARYILGTIS